jgi:hypothetical protein
MSSSESVCRPLFRAQHMCGLPSSSTLRVRSLAARHIRKFRALSAFLIRQAINDSESVHVRIIEVNGVPMKAKCHDRSTARFKQRSGVK